MKRVLLSLIFSVFILYTHAIDNANKACRRVEISKEQSLTKQIRYPNTYYIIRDVLDLEGGTITIPQGSILRFDGGQIKNGTLVGDNTQIDSPPYPLFSDDLTLKGSFLAAEAYPEWFGDDDDAVCIRKALTSFDNVRLTAKHYILKSVDKNGYGIVVPNGHILKGCRRANNTVTYDQIIDLTKGLNYKAVIALESNTTISDVTIRGERREGTSCLATTDSFQSRLTIERVGVSGSFYGFNLQTYLSNLNQCTANYNNVGFYIHGSVTNTKNIVEGTSINISTCYAVDSKINGFEIKGITYSTMNNCAADGCGAPTSGSLTKRTEIGYAYLFENSKNITVSACGAESCLAAIRTDNCKNIIFNTPSFLIAKRRDVRVADDYKIKPIINVRYSAYIEFNKMFLNINEMKNYFDKNTILMLLYGSASSVPSVVIRQGYEGIRESNIGTEGFLTKTKNLIYQ